MDPKVTTEAAAAVLRIFATKCDVVQNVLTSPRTLSRDVFKTAREGRVWGDKTFPDARQADRKNRGTRVPVMSMNKAVHPGFHADCNFKDRNKNANTYIVAYSDFSKAETFIKVYQGTKGAKGKKEDNTLSLFHYVPKHLAGGGSAGTPPLWGWMPLRPEDITDPGDLVSVVGWCTLAMNVPEDDADIAGNPLYAFIMQKVRALLEEGSRRACAKKCRTKAQKRVKTRVVQLNDAEKAVRDAIFAVQTIDAKVAKARNDLSTICLGEDADDDDDDENDEAENVCNTHARTHAPTPIYMHISCLRYTCRMAVERASWR
jgi:hypothetical protein